MGDLHPQLVADTVPISKMQLCDVLLMKDANYPWLVLVPRREDVREIHLLSAADQQRLMREISHVATRLEALTGAYKMNVAALGNIVPQLHVHIIARFEDDAAWPGPVWGMVPATPYEGDALEAVVEKLKRALI